MSSDRRQSKNVLTARLAYAARGWDTFPAPPGKKKSHKSAEYSDGRKWGKTRDPAEIERDWESWPDANVGIATGPKSGIWVVEADTKEAHGVDGIASLAELEREHGPMPPTLMAESPSGSTHFYFNWPSDGGGDIINSASKIRPGIDVRGKGGMVIAPPSVRKDGSYRWLNDLPVAEAPAWLIEEARREEIPEYLKDYQSTGAGTEFKPSDFPSRTDDEIIALLEATRTPGKWHESMLLAIASMIGRGWTDTAIKLSCAKYCEGGYKDIDLVPLIEGGRKKFKKPNEERGPNDGEIERLAMLSTLEYDQQRKEAAKKLDIRTKILDDMVAAARKRQEDAAEGSTGDDGDAWVATINKEYALVVSGNKASIMNFESATKFRLLQISAFRQWFSNQLIRVGKEVTTVGAYWLGHEQRRDFKGIEFEPGGGRQRYYNLWQGFAVQPKEGDCSKFLAHVKDNAARGDEETYKWMIGWWAQIFQQPTIKMETAQVIRGPLGSGKTIIGQIIGSLLADHYLAVAAPRYITGQFNSHMASLLVLHADEAFWAGDRKSEGTLKDLVTGIWHMLEFKGIDAIRVKNYIRLFVCGNPNWLIPAGFKERRWAVFDIGEDHVQDHAYFAAIAREMDNGGREALLHYLLNFDLGQVNLRTIPKTAALLDQQIESMTPEQSWWLDTLMAGTLPAKAHNAEERTCAKEAIHRRYVRHAKLQGVSHKSTETRLGMFLRAQLEAKLKITKPYDGVRQVPCFQFPPLADCRKLFAQKLGQDIGWGEGWENETWVHKHERVDDPDDQLF